MMVLTGGRERTEPEYRKLLEQAGLMLISNTARNSGISILETVCG